MINSVSDLYKTISKYLTTSYYYKRLNQDHSHCLMYMIGSYSISIDVYSDVAYIDKMSHKKDGSTKLIWTQKVDKYEYT